MKKIIGALICYLIMATGLSAHAFSDIALTAGALTTETSPDSDGIDAESGTVFFGGVLGFMEMTDSVMLRSGIVVAQRVNTIKGTTQEGEYTLLNLEAPVTAMYKFNDMIGVFGGARFQINMSDECSGDICDGADAEFETITYGAEVGGHFHFTPNFGAEVAYVMGLSNFATVGQSDDEVAYDGGLIINAFFVF